jgi:PAS domain-containing protein
VGNKATNYSTRDVDYVTYLADVAWELVIRKNAEEELRRSEQRYRSVVEAQTELIDRWLPDGTIILANDAYCQYYGYTYDQ